MGEEITITCMYSCNLCGLTKVKVEVPARGSDEDIKHYLEQVAATCLSEDHARRSPHCRPETLSEVYIPTTGAKYIGGPTEN
jgi:hypothetical protein